MTLPFSKFQVLSTFVSLLTSLELAVANQLPQKTRILPEQSYSALSNTADTTSAQVKVKSVTADAAYRNALKYQNSIAGKKRPAPKALVPTQPSAAGALPGTSQPTVVIVQSPAPVAPVLNPAGTVSQDIKSSGSQRPPLVSQKMMEQMPKGRLYLQTTQQTLSRAKLGKNAFSAEGGGRAGYYSLNYDRMTGSHVGLGLGLSYFTLRTEGVVNSQVHFLMAPIYGNFYFLPNSHRPFATVGATVVSINGTLEESGDIEATLHDRFGSGFSGIAAVPHFGFGYEYRGSSSILVRASVYGAYISQRVLPWAGLSLGTSF